MPTIGSTSQDNDIITFGRIILSWKKKPSWDRDNQLSGNQNRNDLESETLIPLCLPNLTFIAFLELPVKMVHLAAIRLRTIVFAN